MSSQGGGEEGACALSVRQTAKIDILIQKIAGPFASCKKHVCDTG